MFVTCTASTGACYLNFEFLHVWLQVFVFHQESDKGFLCIVFTIVADIVGAVLAATAIALGECIAS